MLALPGRFVTGRRTKWVSIGAWVAAVVAVVAFGLPGRFADAQTNEPSSFLPEDVESVRALKSVAPPRYAPSGDAALITATLPGNGDSATLVDTVRALRERAGRLAGGQDLRAAVTGPAGYAADAVDVFSGINGTLLTVTALLVLVLLILIYRSPVFWMIPLAAVGAVRRPARHADRAVDPRPGAGARRRTARVVAVAARARVGALTRCRASATPPGRPSAMTIRSVAAATLLSVPFALPAPAAAAVPSADFDGDGYADLAIGAPTDSVAAHDAAGAVNVIYGGPHGLRSRGNQEFTQASAGVGDDPELGDRFGSALAAGDFDGDGYADLAVGVPGEGVPTGVGPGEVPRASAGMVQVLYGSRHGLRGRSRLGWTQDRPGVKGTTHARDGFGGTLAAGDFDADGRDDLAIGTPLEPVGDRLAAGSVNVLYGSAAGLTEAGDQLWTLDSPGIKGLAGGGFRFGWALAAGDVSGDGRDDLAIGIPGGRISGMLDAGAVSVLYGRSGGLSAVDDLWSQDARGIKGRAERLDNFGTAVAIGDLDGDGVGDLAIGVQFEDVGGARDAGAVNVLYGSGAGLGEHDDQLWTESTPGIQGAAARRDRFGATLTIADFSRNGADDLAIGVPGEDVGAAQDAGAVNLLYGNHRRGLASRGNQRWTQDARGVKSRADAADLFGTALAAGDFDDDGAYDLAVGVPHETVAGHGLAGAVNVLPGSRHGLRADPDRFITQATTGVSGAVGSDSLGTALAAAR